MILKRPTSKKKRSLQIRRLRVRSLDALSAVESAQTDDEHLDALKACRDALHSLLLGTLPAKTFEELSGKYPALLQPSLFPQPLRSPPE